VNGRERFERGQSTEYPMAVRAKFRVTGRREWTNGGYDKQLGGVEVTLQAVYGEGDDDANKQWSKYTPSGELKMSITNPAAYEQFKIGAAWFIDLSPAEE
jgi:hypothetical protein